jgi:hypothetical protein
MACSDTPFGLPHANLIVFPYVYIGIRIIDDADGDDF